ncbi:MAG TPA: 50S ribosomal protein L21 [Candidatus Dormibacteraeota bacterium]|nr:50S ribosomal protein L21 [Candidatus Dormibacteraeota bacterium]
MPKPDGSLSAVVVSGGKQYRVAPGDRVLVDRLAAEPGSSVKLGRVLLLHEGDAIEVGTPGIEGFEVEAKVLAHSRGPRIEVLRYKSKKHVRVHRGARADLTALEILPFGRHTDEEPEEAEAEEAPKKGARRPRAKKETKETKETKTAKAGKK